MNKIENKNEWMRKVQQPQQKKLVLWDKQHGQATG